MDEKYQVLPDLPLDQYEALKADIAARGVQVAVDVDEYGNILDGHHHVRVCRELGINDYPVAVRNGLSEEEKRVYARKANVLRRHLNCDQIRELVAEQLRDTPDLSIIASGRSWGSMEKQLARCARPWRQLRKFRSWTALSVPMARRGRLVSLGRRQRTRMLTNTREWPRSSGELSRTLIR